MRAVIPAAGVASRLRPLTSNKPKCLLEIGGKPLIQRAFEGLIQNGVREFTVVTGYLQEQIVDFLRKRFPELDIAFVYNERYASTNNIYSLWLGLQQANNEDILLLDSDIAFDPKIVAELLACPKPNALALNPHSLGEEEIKVIVDGESNVLEISKVCSIEKAAGESIGIEKMSAAYTRALFKELDTMINREGLDNIFYERAFERLIPQGFSFYALDTGDYFSMELDTVEDFREAKNNGFYGKL